MRTARDAVFPALLASLPGLALAQAATAEPAEPRSLFWLWIAVAVVLLAALVLILKSQEPRARASSAERARRELHGSGPRTVEH